MSDNQRESLPPTSSVRRDIDKLFEWKADKGWVQTNFKHLEQLLSKLDKTFEEYKKTQEQKEKDMNEKAMRLEKESSAAKERCEKDRQQEMKSIQNLAQEAKDLAESPQLVCPNVESLRRVEGQVTDWNKWFRGTIITVIGSVFVFGALALQHFYTQNNRIEKTEDAVIDVKKSIEKTEVTVNDVKKSLDQLNTQTDAMQKQKENEKAQLQRIEDLIVNKTHK